MTEKRFWVVPLDYYGEQRFVRDNDLIGEKSMSNEEVVECLNNFDKENQALHKEVRSLTSLLKEITDEDEKDSIEIKHINNIYKELGFHGVIDYAKDKLSQYGRVRKVEDGLWVMITGGWSDNEHWIHCLNSILCFFSYKHYVGYERGGAFYYTEEPHGDIEISLKKGD